MAAHDGGDPALSFGISPQARCPRLLPTSDFFSSPPAGGQNLPTGAHSRRCTGLRAGARVSKRASAPGSSVRTHAGNTSTVDSVLGLPVFVVPYKSPFLQLQHWNRGGFDGSQRTAYSIHCVCISETEKVKIGQALFLAKGHSD